jgi:hypothetical protein
MTTMTPDQRAYTLRCARMLAETGEDADSVDALIAKAVDYRPMDGRERLNLTVRGRRIAPEDKDILIRRLNVIRQAAGAGPWDDARLYRVLRTYVLSLND